MAAGAARRATLPGALQRRSAGPSQSGRLLHVLHHDHPAAGGPSANAVMNETCPKVIFQSQSNCLSHFLPPLSSPSAVSHPFSGCFTYIQLSLVPYLPPLPTPRRFLSRS